MKKLNTFNKYFKKAFISLLLVLSFAFITIAICNSSKILAVPRAGEGGQEEEDSFNDSRSIISLNESQDNNIIDLNNNNGRNNNINNVIPVADQNVNQAANEHIAQNNNNNQQAAQGGWAQLTAAQKKERLDACAKTITAVTGYLNDLIKKNGQADHIKHGVNILKNSINLGLTLAFPEIPGLGQLVGSVMDAVTSFIKIWDGQSQSETEMLMSFVADQINLVRTDIAKARNEIAELSNKTDESVDVILDALRDSLEAYYAKNQVNDFLSSTSGNFSYRQLKRYLYSNGSSGYALILMEKLLDKNVSEEVKKDLSDQLYSILMSKNDVGASNLDMLYESICPDGGTKLSIFEYYNEYLLSNQSYITTSSPAAASIQFMEDVYNTFLTAVSHVKSLNLEQINYMLLNANSFDNIDKDNIFNDTTLKYTYGSKVDEFNTLKKIQQINSELDEMLINVEAQVAKDMAYILKLDKTYLYKTDKSAYISAFNTDDKTFGNVEEGYHLYFSPMNQSVAELFGFNINEYDYKVYDSKNNQLNVGKEKNNQFLVEGTEPFTLVVTYNQKNPDGTAKLDKNGNPIVNQVYQTTFRVGVKNTFGGGTGSTTDPYIIGTKEQFLLMRNTDRHKSYKLVTDIDLGGMELEPFFGDINQYEGTFNGNGYSIKNFTIKSQSDNASLFGIIGYSGRILNVKIDNATISKENNHNAKTLYAGVLASINNGVIYNVTVNNATVTASRNSKATNGNINNAIAIKVGGLVGENNGTIQYSNVYNTKVTGSSKRDYGANADGSNANVTYVGGVIGYSSSTSSLNYASVDSNLKLVSFIGCFMKEQLSYRYPKGTAYAAGICPVNDGALMDNLYVPRNISISTNYDYKNDAWSGGSGDRGLDVKSGYEICMGKYKAIGEDQRKIEPVANEYEAHLEAKGKIDTKYNICENLIFKPGTKSFNVKGLVLVIKNKTTSEETIIENPSFYSVKGFDSRNNSVTEAKTGAVMVVVLVPGFNTMFTFTLDFVILPNTPEAGSIPQISGEINKFPYDANAQIIENANAHETLGYDITVRLADGTEKNVNDIAKIDKIDRTKYGKQTVTISVLGLTKEVCVVIECDSHSFESKEVIEGHKKIDDKYDCNGYDYKECTICHYSESVPFDDREHDVELINAKEATCSGEGYTGDLVAKTTETNKYIVIQGDTIPLKEHTYVDDPNDDKYHTCSACGHKDEHLYYIVEDGSDLTNQLIYKCATCGHTTIDIKNSREEIMSLPRVVVNDVYALDDSAFITVYITLHSNIGITSANFSVTFDERLVLVSYKYGNILGGGASIDSIKVYGNHINVVLAQSEADTSTDGILLKLMFDISDERNVGDIYKVGVVNKGTGDKFTDKNGKKVDFIAYDGYIIIVDHLPGDINGDGKIDILDPILISNYIVLDDNEKNEYITKMKEINDKFNMDYADINSDGRIDTDDIVGIMRYIVGEYEQQIVSSLYVVNLNYNDKSGRVEPYVVNYNNGQGKYGDPIKPGVEHHLPTPEREGYIFDGWYCEIDGCGVKVTDDTLVQYDARQYTQTLYAHYIMNEITFDSNGGSGIKPTISYRSGGDLENKDNNNKPYLTKTITVKYDGNDGWGSVEKTYDLEFKGWSLAEYGTQIDPSAYQLDLKGANAFGSITLYAIWKGVLIEPIQITRQGYEFKGWYTTPECRSGTEFNKNFAIASNMTLYAYFENVYYNVSYDANGGSGSMSPHLNCKYSDQEGDATEITIRDNKFSSLNGYEFAGWSTTPNGSAIYQPGQTVKNLTTATQNNTVTVLYAVWVSKYKISFNANNPNATGTMTDINDVLYNAEIDLPECGFTYEGHQFIGWALSSTGSVEFNDKDKVSYLSSVNNDTVVLYAVWS